MAEASPTRLSLLVRLKDHRDADAWSQFVEIYGPLIFQLGRRCGFQDSDAADLVQEVMSEVAKSIERFEYDPQLGRFRSWLYKVAKRTMRRVQSRARKQPAGTGDSHMLKHLESQPDVHDETEEYWDHEYQQYLLHWAAERVRGQFQPETWQAFWMTAVEQKAPQTVARALEMSVGAVYVARSRVMKRLTEKVREIDDQS